MAEGGGDTKGGADTPGDLTEQDNARADGNERAQGPFEVVQSEGAPPSEDGRFDSEPDTYRAVRSPGDLLPAVSGEGPVEEEYSPQVSIGIPVLIPQSYVSDLNLRMELYRRVSRLASDQESEAFAAELIDRFGKLPGEVENLLQTVAIKRLCRRAHIDKVDSGPKGAVVSFRGNEFPNPGGLIGYITEQVGTVKLRPDHKLVLKRAWDGGIERLKGVTALVRMLADIAEADS